MNTLVVRLSLGPFCDVIKLIWKRPKCIVPILLTYLNSRGPYIMLYVLLYLPAMLVLHFSQHIDLSTK